MGRRWTAVAGASLAILVLVGLLAVRRTPYAIEGRVGRWVFDLPSVLTPPFEVVMQAGTRLAIVLVAAGLAVAGRYRAAGASALAGLAGWFAASELKDELDRPRPRLVTLGRAPREMVDTAAWPSSHVTIAAALATVLLLTVARGPIAKGVCATAVALTAAARVHLGVHWGLDVVGGAALGILAGYVAVLVVRPR